MTVYEATTEQHFKKIVSWLGTQPAQTFSLTCWGRLADVAKRQAYEIEVLKYWKESDKTLGIFVCEDKNKVIRFVFIRRLIPAYGGGAEPPIARAVTAFMDNQDYTNDKIDYLLELMAWLTKEDNANFGVKIAEIPIDDKYLKFVHRVVGESNIKIVDQFDNELFGRMYLIHINLGVLL